MPMDAEIDDSLEIVEHRSSGEQTSEEEEPQALLIVFYPGRQPVPYRLHIGVNVIGRQSSFAQRDSVRLHKWSSDYEGVSVHGLFLEGSSISSAHAAIFLEAWGESCFVTDLRSRNKTFLRRGGKHVALKPEQKQPLQSGDTLTFGALRCRVSFGGSSEGGATPSGGSPTARGICLGLRASSRAISIGQRTASPGTPAGRSSSLDKCPSLQEWFQHPARSTSSGGAQSLQQSPFAGESNGRGWTEEDVRGSNSQESLLNPMPSFGFEPTIPEAEENTSSDAEPETPRIDKPAAFQSPKLKPQPSPFAVVPRNASLSPMLEGEEDVVQTTVNSSELQDTAAPAEVEPPEEKGHMGASRSSLELGAVTLTQLKTVPLKGSLAGESLAARGSPPSPSGTLGTEDLESLPMDSPTTSVGEQPWVSTPPSAFSGAESLAASGRPIRARQKSPTPKRSRSGRVVSPDKALPRSKSPRLQRGFYVDERATATAERHMEMGAMRDAVRDIWSDM